MMMREEPARDGRDRRADAERADLHRRDVEAEQVRGRLVVMHRPQLQPQPRTLQQEHGKDQKRRPDPHVAHRHELHAVEPARAAGVGKIQEEAAHHLAEAEGGHGEVDALEPQRREADDHADDPRGERRDQQRRRDRHGERHRQHRRKIGADPHERAVAERELPRRQDDVDAQGPEREDRDVGEKRGLVRGDHSRLPSSAPRLPRSPAGRTSRMTIMKP